MKSIFKSSSNHSKEFISPLFQKLLDSDYNVYGMNKSLPNLKGPNRKEGFLGIMTTKGFMPSSEDEKEIFPHKVSSGLISNRWDILKLFNRGSQLPNNYEVFTSAFYNNVYIGIKDIPLDYKLSNLITIINSYMKEFYSNKIDHLVFKNEFIKKNKEVNKKYYKLFGEDTFPEYIRQLEYSPFYSIRYKLNINDIVNSKDIKLVTNESFIIEKDSNNNYYTTFTVLIFPFNKIVSVLTFDSDVIVLLTSDSYDSIEEVDKKIDDISKKCVMNYFYKIEDMDKERKNTEQYLNNSPLPTNMKEFLVSTINNVNQSINKTYDLTLCKTINNQTIEIIFGNLFNNLLYEYITNKNKYLILFNDVGDKVKIVNKASDLPLLKSSYLLNGGDEKKSFFLLNSNKELIKETMNNILYKAYREVFKDNIFSNIEDIIISKYNKFISNDEDIGSKLNFNSLPMIDCEIGFYNSGISISLRLYYDIENETDIYNQFIAFDLVTYNIYKDKIKVKYLYEKSKIDIDSFEELMRSRLTNKKILRKSSKRFKSDICEVFLSKFVDYFRNIRDIRKALYKIQKDYIDIMNNNKQLKDLKDEIHRNKVAFNNNKHGCSIINDLNKQCNNIKYSKSESLNKFLIETKYYVNWNYVLKEIDVQ